MLDLSRGAVHADEHGRMHLGQSIVMVSFPVEVWKQPRVLDSGASYIELVKEPVV